MNDLNIIKKHETNPNENIVQNNWFVLFKNASIMKCKEKFRNFFPLREFKRIGQLYAPHIFRFSFALTDLVGFGRDNWQNLTKICTLGNSIGSVFKFLILKSFYCSNTRAFLLLQSLQWSILMFKGKSTTFLNLENSICVYIEN